MHNTNLKVYNSWLYLWGTTVINRSNFVIFHVFSCCVLAFCYLYKLGSKGSWDMQFHNSQINKNFCVCMYLRFYTLVISFIKLWFQTRSIRQAFRLGKKAKCSQIPPTQMWLDCKSWEKICWFKLVVGKEGNAGFG